jgi:DNA-directed RNA polymerase subunit RPC12/RpoP
MKFIFRPAVKASVLAFLAHFLDVFFRRCLIIAQLTPTRGAQLVMANPGAGGKRTNTMADMKFSCSHCGQDIECDELWSGHEIQCPTCKGQLVVPPKPEAPPHANLASAKPNQPRLSIGHSRDQRSAAPPPPPPQEVIMQAKMRQAKTGKKGSAKKWVTIGAVVVILGVGGYLGYPYLHDWMAKRSEAAKQASTPPAVTNAEPAEAPPAPKELPVLPAVWTLDVEQAKIPEGKANGTLGATDFMVENALCVPQLLRLSQGSPSAPDRELQIFLRLSAGESLTGHTWTISAQDPAGKSVPQVVKRWKADPRYAAQSKTFSSGYAMKLELGAVEANMITVKIFLALPDTEKSVVAGVFKAATGMAGASGAAAAMPGMVPGRMDRSAYERYGARKR